MKSVRILSFAALVTFSFNPGLQAQTATATDEKTTIAQSKDTPVPATNQQKTVPNNTDQKTASSVNDQKADRSSAVICGTNGHVRNSGGSS